MLDIAQYVKQKNVKVLVKYYFKFNLTPKQEEIVRLIAYAEHPRACINAMTRYGKSRCVAIGVALYILFHKDKRIAIIAPQEEQASIIRNYIAEHIVCCPILAGLVDIDRDNSIERLKRETSRRRWTFKNGCQLLTISAHGEATRLMGFGADLVICVPKGQRVMTNKGEKDIKNIVDKKLKLKVLSYNTDTQKLEYQPIKRYFKNARKDKILEIETNLGSFRVTENHPVFEEKRGYIAAKKLRENDKIYKCVTTSKKDANSYVQYLQNPILQETEPYKKAEESELKFLQSQMQRRLAERRKKSYVGRWQERNIVQRMWKFFLCRSKHKEKKSVLFSNLSFAEYPKARKKTFFDFMRILWKAIKGNSCNERHETILFKKVCEQRSFRENANGGQSCMEGRDRKSSLASRVQYKTKEKNQKKRWKCVFSLWENWKALCSSYRLRQKQFSRKQSNNSLCELSHKNKLQKRNVEIATIKSIKSVNTKDKYVYNLEIANNNNYFVNGFLTHNCDESAKISREAYAKIVRMLGDDPENSVLIELANPWDMDNKYYDHYVSGRFLVIHVGYKTAIEEGRVTETFIDEMRDELTPIEFTVLYESVFPPEAEDSLFRLKDINNAIENNFLSRGDGIIACDPSDKGLDFTVIMYGHESDGLFKVEYVYHEPKSDNMQIVNRIVRLVDEKEDVAKINVDCIGIGAGIVSRLNEIYPDGIIQVNACHFGEAPEEATTVQAKLPTSSRKRFMNKKAEQYFRLQNLMVEKRVDIPNNITLRSELMKMKWDKTLSEKIKIVDPEDKSPDFADCLVYFVWSANKEVVVMW